MKLEHLQFAAICLSFSFGHHFKTRADDTDGEVFGSWSYRQIVSKDFDADAVREVENGILELSHVSGKQDSLRGRIILGAASVEVNGTFREGKPQEARFRGQRVINGIPVIEEWHGSVVPNWPNRDHELLLFGTMTRKLTDSDQASERRAHWVAVREDSPGVSSAARVVDLFTPNGKPSVLIFVKDSLCVHCREQVIEMGEKLPNGDADVFVVSASNEADIAKFPPLPFRLVADADHRLSKHFGVFTHEAKHATIVRDGSGMELLRKVGDEPYTRVDAVVVAINEARLRSRQ